uniref:Uncharacterized protein n=1 Tax=Arundo donax TaxID=35708 RepID=A0A0A9BA07_ARUDO
MACLLLGPIFNIRRSRHQEAYIFSISLSYVDYNDIKLQIKLD